MKKVLVIGSGGREHALAKKLLASPRVERVYVAPGNGGTEEMCVNVSIDAMDFDGLIRFAREEVVDLTGLEFERLLSASGPTSALRAAAHYDRERGAAGRARDEQARPGPAR